MNEIQVKGSKILLTPHPEALNSGLSIPEDGKPKPKIGTVYSVGTKVMDYKSGDVVFFPAGTGTEIQIDGSDFLLIHDENGIIGTLHELGENAKGKVQKD
jgi:co-chaperonin GroES (HSP10)